MSETPRTCVRPTPRTIKIRPGKVYEEREMKLQEVASTATNAAAGGGALLHWIREVVIIIKVEKIEPLMFSSDCEISRIC